MYRKVWISDNQKYKVLVRKFENSSAVMVGFWKLDTNGKNKDVRYKNLPEYVKAKIKEMQEAI